MYQIELIDTSEKFYSFSLQWKRFLEQSPAKTVFQSFEWYYAWWNVVGCKNPETELYILVIRQNGDIQGIVPLMIQHEWDSQVLTFLSRPYADYHDFILQSDNPKQVLSEIIKYLREIQIKLSYICLDEIPESSVIVSFCKSALHQTCGSKLTLRTSSVCPQLDLTDQKLFDIVINKRAHKNKANRLANIGTLRCYHHFTPESILSRLPQFKAMHKVQWGNRHDAVATFDDPNVNRFFSELVNVMAPKGWIMLSELVLDERPIAYYFSFVYNKTYWGYRSCFDIELSRCSPGHIMLTYILHFLRNNGYTTFDFLRGDYKYKYRYANRELQNYQIVFET